MILAHHGGELPLVVATLAGAGTVAPLAVLVRARLRGRRRLAQAADAPALGTARPARTMKPSHLMCRR